jgi:hypothetical protein
MVLPVKFSFYKGDSGSMQVSYECHRTGSKSSGSIPYGVERKIKEVVNSKRGSDIDSITNIKDWYIDIFDADAPSDTLDVVDDSMLMFSFVHEHNGCLIETIPMSYNARGGYKNLLFNIYTQHSHKEKTISINDKVTSISLSMIMVLAIMDVLLDPEEEYVRP